MGGLLEQSISHVGIVLSTHKPKEHSKLPEGVYPFSQLISHVESEAVSLHVTRDAVPVFEREARVKYFVSFECTT